LPTLCKGAQNIRQLVEPCLNLGSEARRETPTYCIVDPRNRRTHRADVSEAAIEDFAPGDVYDRDVRELQSGLWQWMAWHPDWTPSDPWGQDVSSYPIVTLT
jgi:hypothetical protein